MYRVLLFVHLCWCAWSVLGSATLLGQEPDQKPVDKKLQRLADDSRSRAEAIKVSVMVGDQATDATLHPEPLMKYTDIPRFIEMGTLWVWEVDGRPVAIGKVEVHQLKEATRWLHCFSSTWTGLVDARWMDGHRFQPKKPGLEWVTVKDLIPHETTEGRKRQMKELFQRLTATTYDDRAKMSDELRPLARHLHEYSSPKQGVLEGFLCGFTNGTNPDVVIALEAINPVEDKDTPKSWRYAVIGMTANGVKVKLDRSEVFTLPYAKSPEKYDTRTYFWEGAPKK
jgi:hypothetical protein